MSCNGYTGNTMIETSQAPFQAVLDSWQISARVTAHVVENLSDAVWRMPLPGSPRRSVGSLAAHLHNSRCMWLKSMGPEHGVAIPAPVRRAAVTRAELLASLGASNRAIDALLRAGIGNDGVFPGSRRGFVWGAMPRDVVRFVAYGVSHEAHHRGQMVMLARQLGHRLPARAIAGLWQWSARLRESREEQS